jgi:hypothetical protein
VTVEGDKVPFDRMNELTEQMMLRIAHLMPAPYWGFYRQQMQLSAHQAAEKTADARARPHEC